ncbi:unconventional myosin-Ie-like isoform X2 [Oratosquilla oratoria]|uniref:unconventional myosin-Ie-like isoform X2 n=1 Tax=Oratosquilla oratoria TaxID=337810 RepID=UPI003F766708
MNSQQMYHWQSGGGKSTIEDMVLLAKITEPAIVENLKKRFMEDKIYTYIGPVLVAVNPFKQLPYFGEKEVEIYQGAYHYEVPPHIYAIAYDMYRDMLIDYESQCVIISGESGAGKTVSAKYIMNFITKVSGGGPKVQQVKDVIIESNPLLEALGNAKTMKNNNSSRFGKYIEIQFSKSGEPLGGKISNFLLEKSRVHSLSEGERSFHIFYQLCLGATPEMKENLGITSMDYYYYLNQTKVYKVPGVNDAEEFKETLKAMSVMGMDKDRQMDILRIVAAILHMSNISFFEEGNNAVIADHSYLEFPAYLLGINSEQLEAKLKGRTFYSHWGGKSEKVEVTNNVEQAQFARDAWAKSLYARMFDYVVKTVNKAMETDSTGLDIGILDIYGFEIFSRNGFEQFCINYVNEKLQQIFIELTLKSEQEEYNAEGIHWTPIKYFNNKIVCDLIESKKPPGIMCVLDDTCATMNAVSEGADEDFKRKMGSQVSENPHYMPFKDGFTIKHYAGNVSYHIEGFCEKNRDVLVTDIIEVMQTSSNAFIQSLFPDKINQGVKGRPTTAGSKIKTQANELVGALMKCVPHYIRCIKPNETKKPRDWNEQMVKHQVEYLGLKDNIKVKRAGFAYRRVYEKFLQRYAILCKETFPHWNGHPHQGIHLIMNSVNMDSGQYQIGRTKIFVKDPESLYLLEEYRERKYDHYARVIQSAFRKYFSKQILLREKEEASDLILNRKERRSNSLNRAFYGDYIGIEFKPRLAALIPRGEKIQFAQTVNKFDRWFKSSKRHLILTKYNLYLIGREKVKRGPEKGQTVEAVKRKIPLENFSQISLSKYQDDFVLLHVSNDYESLLEVTFKTEFIMVLNRKLKEKFGRELALNFVNSFEYSVKKKGFGGGSRKKVIFSEGLSDTPECVVSGSTFNIKIAHGLPVTSRPSLQRRMNEKTQRFVQEVKRNSLNGNNRRIENRNIDTNNKENPPHGNRNPVRRAPVGPPRGVKQPSPFNTVGPYGHSAVRLPMNIERMGNQPPPPPEDPAPSDQPTIQTGHLGRTNSHQVNSIKRQPLPPKPNIKQAKALYSFDARDASELSFVVDDLLQIIQEDDSGWWMCRQGRNEGFCPANYLQKL